MAEFSAEIRTAVLNIISAGTQRFSIVNQNLDLELFSDTRNNLSFRITIHITHKTGSGCRIIWTWAHDLPVVIHRRSLLCRMESDLKGDLCISPNIYSQVTREVVCDASLSECCDSCDGGYVYVMNRVTKVVVCLANLSYPALLGDGWEYCLINGVTLAKSVLPRVIIRNVNPSPVKRASGDKRGVQCLEEVYDHDLVLKKVKVTKVACASGSKTPSDKVTSEGDLFYSGKGNGGADDILTSFSLGDSLDLNASTSLLSDSVSGNDILDLDANVPIVGDDCFLSIAPDCSDIDKVFA